MTKSVPTARGSMTASELRDDLIMQAVNDDDFRARLIADPRATLQDIYGISLPERLNVIVHEDDSTTAHIVLPRSKRLTDEELEASAGGEADYY